MPAVVLEELVGVCEVEVSGEQKGMAEFARLVDERVAERLVVSAECGVAQVAEEYPLFEIAWRAFRDHAENVGKRGVACRLEHPVGRRSGGGVGGEDRRARAVLAAVVLLFEEERELRASEIAVAIVAFPQGHHRNGAFMLHFVGHPASL